MRKPLMLLSLATSAALLASGLAEAAALAEPMSVAVQAMPADPAAAEEPAWGNADRASEVERVLVRGNRAAGVAPAVVTGNRRVGAGPALVNPNRAGRVQLRVLALVNENRRRGGCGNLTLNRRLSAAAFGHAADMARRGYFAHRSRNGESVGDRVHDAGYLWSRYGENIARGQGSARAVVRGWMHSRPHRANIMNCRLHEMGIGRAYDRRGTPYWVQDFATSR